MRNLVMPPRDIDLGFNLYDLHKSMEADVVAYNKYLRKKVKQMSIMTLLRHVHPLDRETYARRLHVLKSISSKEMNQFKPKKKK